MDQFADHYCGFYWEDRKQTLSSYLLTCKKTIDAIREFSGFDGGVSLTSSRPIVDLGVLPGEAEYMAVGDRVLDPAITYKDDIGEDGQSGPSTISGFTSIWRLEHGDGSYAKASLSIGAFGPSSPGNAIVLNEEITGQSSSTLCSSELFRRLIVEFDCDDAVVTSRTLRKILDPDQQRMQTVGWLSYLRDTRIAAIKGLPTGTINEDFHNGVLIRVPDENVFSMDRETVSDLSVVYRALVRSGLLK